MRIIFALIQTMRPRQWTKNILFVFPGIIFDGKLFDLESLGHVLVACVLLVMMSGSVYIINDLADVENDRRHPQKKNRPIAAGKLPLRFATAAAFVIPLFTLAFAILFYRPLALVLGLYLLIQVGYSFYLKHVVIVDVLTVMIGFVLRVIAGVVVIQVENFSPWLYVCAGLLALFLAIGKRRQELVTLGENAVQARPIFRNYNLPLLNDMLQIVTTSTLITYIIYTLDADTRKLADVNSAFLTIPFVLYGLYRYLYLIHVKGEGSAPDEVLLKDRGLQIAMLLWGTTFMTLIYLFPGIG